MKKQLAGLCAALLLTGCVSVSSTNVETDRPLTKKKQSAKAWEENVSGKPIVLRRTTLVVKDIEKSLALYRDALGMTVQYDQELKSPNLKTRHGDDGVNRSRLVFLQADNEFIGVIGLWQFLDQTEKDLAEPDAADLTPGEFVFVFNTDDLDATFKRAAATPGVTVIDPPEKSFYPSEAGTITTLVSMLVDPDGHTIELNQVLSDPRREIR